MSAEQTRFGYWVVLIGLAACILSARTAVGFTGACCKTDGTCVDVANLAACNAVPGFYIGDGSACASTDCSRGACVRNILGGNDCVMTSKPECDLQEGYWVPPPDTCASIIMTSYGVFTSPHGGQFNISGATLFADFFDNTPASTNDFYNMDNDQIHCRQPDTTNSQIVSVGPNVEFANTDCNPGLDGTDQLAPAWTCGGWRGHWLVQYRSVGSIEGFSEFVEWQLTGILPANVPSERGLINGVRWASGGVVGGPAAACQADCGAPGPAGNTGTPVCPKSIDAGNTDVPSAFGVVAGVSSDARWDRKPTDSGYGLNMDQSAPNNGLSTVPQLASLERPGFGSLNLNIAAPDANTIYDTRIAWSPVACIANRGTGKMNIRYTELQHLYVTGRMPNGENLVGQCRDVGSGTRNAWANSLAIDPSHASGDNFGPRIESTIQAQLGYVPTNQVPLPAGSRTQPSHCGSSTISEAAVQSWRLAIGYTGLVGTSRTEGDIAAGLYEMLNVCKDVDADGVGIPGFACSPQLCDNSVPPSSGGVVPRHPSCPTPPANTTTANNGYVRANLFNVLDNSNPLCSYQIGGIQTLNTRGDPLSGPGIPPYAAGTSNPPMSNLAARDYIRNLLASVAAYIAAPGTPDANLMPAQLFANKFFLNAAVDAVHQPLNPTDFSDSVLLQAVQDNVRCNNTVNIRDFGSINIAGRVPTRNDITACVMCMTYSDGARVAGYDSTGLGNFTLGSGVSLNHRNQTSGDFFYDGVRNIKDIPEMLKALKNPRQYQRNEVLAPPAVLPGVPVTPNPLGTMGSNYVVPEIIGDFNGDGSFNAADVRYFADGLAIDPSTGRLNRCMGWELVDQWWLYYDVGAGTSFPDAAPVRPEYAGPKPPWHPTLPGYMPAWPHAVTLGAAMADIAGAMASPGWEPTGHDGIVNGLDIDYIYANFGDFTNLRYDAARIDLSADMNGDLRVDQLDVDKVVRDVLCTHYGDANLDGLVNAADQAIVNGNLGNPGGWADGDFSGDGMVTAADQAVYNANAGAVSSCRVHCLSDLNCDGKRNGLDVQEFIRAVLDPAGYDMAHMTCGCVRHNADATADGIVNELDIPGVVADLLVTTPCPL